MIKENFGFPFHRLFTLSYLFLVFSFHRESEFTLRIYLSTPIHLGCALIDYSIRFQEPEKKANSLSLFSMFALLYRTFLFISIALEIETIPLAPFTFQTDEESQEVSRDLRIDKIFEKRSSSAIILIWCTFFLPTLRKVIRYNLLLCIVNQ